MCPPRTLRVCVCVCVCMCVCASVCVCVPLSLFLTFFPLYFLSSFVLISLLSGNFDSWKPHYRCKGLSGTPPHPPTSHIGQKDHNRCLPLSKVWYTHMGSVPKYHCVRLSLRPLSTDSTPSPWCGAAVWPCVASSTSLWCRWTSPGMWLPVPFSGTCPACPRSTSPGRSRQRAWRSCRNLGSESSLHTKLVIYV